MIQDLLLCDTSEYRTFKEKSESIQNDYYEKFVGYINHVKEIQIDELMKENTFFLHVKNLIDSEVFKNMIGNNKYRKQVQCVFNQQYILGQSSIGLIKLGQNIEDLCQQYVQHYEEFIDEASKQVEKDVKKMSPEEQKEILELNRNNICTFHFFNEISNANID